MEISAGLKKIRDLQVIRKLKTGKSGPFEIFRRENDWFGLRWPP